MEAVKKPTGTITSNSCAPAVCYRHPCRATLYTLGGGVKGSPLRSRIKLGSVKWFKNKPVISRSLPPLWGVGAPPSLTHPHFVFALHVQQQGAKTKPPPPPGRTAAAPRCQRTAAILQAPGAPLQGYAWLPPPVKHHTELPSGLLGHPPSRPGSGRRTARA